MNEITEEQFSAFEEVRASGATNMWDTKTVAKLTDDFLDREQVLAIISSYDKLDKKYPWVKETYA